MEPINTIRFGDPLMFLSTDKHNNTNSVKKRVQLYNINLVPEWSLKECYFILFANTIKSYMWWLTNMT